MLIKEFNSINKEIIKEIREVEAACKEHDKLTENISLDTSLNVNPEIKNLFLLYEDSKLVSLISLFIPTAEEAEVSAYTLPYYRNKGYFKRLLDEAIEEIRKYNISSLIFVCEPQSDDGSKTIKALNAELDHTEYVLKYQEKSNDIATNLESVVELRKAGQKDLEAIIGLSQAVFNDGYDNAKSIIVKTLEAKNRVQYIAVLREKLIGMVSVSLENNEASIFGLGVSPQSQGKGYGKEILKLLLKDLRNSGIENITIEVDSGNQIAFNLYKKSGFQVETSFDYFKKGAI